jgi:hypothetical protein
MYCLLKIYKLEVIAVNQHKRDNDHIKIVMYVLSKN